MTPAGLTGLQSKEYEFRYRKRYSDKTANKLTQGILIFLNLNECHAECVANMGRKDRQK